MIREDLFVARMTEHWRSLGNCPSRDLQAVWKQLCRTLNEQSIATDNKWRVVQPATGTGKSQGLALYAALHKDQPQLGILIVVRLISQADEMAALINRLAGVEIAKARHTENSLTTAEMAATQVLVVTHKAYELSLDKYGNGCEQRFSSFVAYDGCFEGQRSLVVIDECLDVVKQYQVNLDDLSFALGAIPYEIRKDPVFSSQFQQLEKLERRLKEVMTSSDTGDRLLASGAEDLPHDFDLKELRDACKQIAWDEVILNTESLKDRARVADKIDRTLEAAQATLEQWHFYSRKGKLHTLNTSSLVVPDDIKGAVVLDATASQNLLYRLFEDRVDIKPVVEARSYRNVTLHVARAAGVGKSTMKKLASSRVRNLIDDLSQRLPAKSKVFVCCHKDIEHHLTQYETPFEMRTGHWGAIDGRNDYRDCDTFVCFGLPYRDRITSSNIYFAFKGPQGDDWLQQPSKRADHGYADIRQAIEEGQVAADVIQAINRIRVRRVIDEHGNCEPANCYLLLGQDALSERLLESIRKAMPGITIKDWSLAIDQKEAKPKGTRNYHRSRYAESLCKFLEGRSSGKWSASQLRSLLDIPAERWKALSKQLKTENSPLFKRLADLGCQFITEGVGRGARSYILKTG